MSYLDLIKEALESSGNEKAIKIILIDSDGNVVSDISLSDLRDALKGADNKDFSTLEADVEGIKTQTDKLQFDANNLLRIALGSDEVGIAKESTLASRLARELELDDGSGTYDKLYRSGNALLIAINEDKVGIAKEDTLSALKNALDSVGTDKLRTSVVDAIPESPFNITKVAGTALTGRDWSDDFAKLQSLDVLLSTRAPKDEGETITICTNADISGGVTASLKNFKRWTLYLKVAAAMDITIELSPDGGTTWYEAPESPISFSAAGDDIIEMGYDATDIKLTGSTTDAVTAQIRGVY